MLDTLDRKTKNWNNNQCLKQGKEMANAGINHSLCNMGKK